MSPPECSECFGDHRLRRTYTWHLTLHSQPNIIRDTRPESLEIPVNVILPQRGTAEPFLRLLNLYPTPRCARQATLPRLSRRVVSQHSYPLNCFSSVPLDPLEHPTSQADLELDYNPPRVQLSDEMFVFQDRRWVSKNRRLQSSYFSPSSSFHHKLQPKRLSRELLLRDENKALCQENKILQSFWEEHKTTLGWEESRASSPLLPKDSTSLEAAKKDPALQMHRSKEDGTLQLLRGENCAPKQLLEQRRAYWAQVGKTTPAEEDRRAPLLHEEPHSPRLLPDQGPGLSSPSEEPKPWDLQEDPKTLRALREMVNNLSSSSRQEESRGGPGLPDGGQSLELLREMNQVRQALQSLQEENQNVQALQEEHRALHVLREEHRAFREESRALWENNTLQLQQRLVIDTVTEVPTRMQTLVEELSALTPARSKEPKKPSRV
ncbi:protein chibby homolog 2 isoform X1 [Manis pentadactyla]|uniref:protein chibby homolog 2 isoform X1 n=1 Tax=Manis pentadactyla TaxID=143292 RepID=UPI00255CB71C|nr:protein chibby homolog 2 isoform X1 [Manis pentadactyla]